MKFVGANPNPQIIGTKRQPGKINYFIGNDRARWISNIPTYASVEYKGLYPAIDRIYYGNQSQLEYDLVISPGADPNSVRFVLQDSERVTIDVDGSMVLQTTDAEIRLRRPILYQAIGNDRHDIRGGYVLLNENEVGFSVAAYDRQKPLVIDPVLDYATYLVPFVNSDRDMWPKGIAADERGNVYITGESCLRTTVATASTCDAFVSKLDSSGSTLIYTTYVGGSGFDYANAIAIDDHAGFSIYDLTVIRPLANKMLGEPSAEGPARPK
jgi:hypothetical protein